MLCLAVPAVVAAQESTLTPAVEKAFELYCSLPSVLVPVLQEATSKTSADTAAKKLPATYPAIFQAREAIRNIPALTAQQNQAVQERYALRMRTEWARMYAEIERLRIARCYESMSLWKEFRTMCMMIEK